MSIGRLTGIILTVALFGCATGYQESGFTGGFTETRVSENAWVIRFDGNGYTGAGRVRDYALLRAAEVTLQNGFRYFIVQDEENSAKTYVVMNNGTGHAGSKPSAERTIVCFKEKPQSGGIVYDAEFINTSLKAKYKLGW